MSGTVWSMPQPATNRRRNTTRENAEVDRDRYYAMSSLRTRPYETCSGPADTCRMCFKKLAGRAGGFRHLMKATIFGSHSLLTLKTFRRSTVTVCLCCPTPCKERYATSRFDFKQNRGNCICNHLASLLLLPTPSKPHSVRITKLVRSYYSPHRRNVLKALL